MLCRESWICSTRRRRAQKKAILPESRAPKDLQRRDIEALAARAPAREPASASERVQHVRERVDRLPGHVHLVVEMRAGGAPRGADEADQLASADALALADA